MYFAIFYMSILWDMFSLIIKYIFRWTIPMFILVGNIILVLKVDGFGVISSFKFDSSPF